MKKFTTKHKIILGIVFLSYIFFGHLFTKNQWKNDSEHFDKSEIKAELSYIGIKHKKCNFYIKGDSVEYIFSPYTAKINNYNIFDHLAEPGDFVIKPKFADTLKLIKEGKTYYYTFDRYEE